MKTQLLMFLLPMILKGLGQGVQSKDLIDALLDVVEERIAGTKSKLDDAVFIPMINAARQALEILKKERPASGRT